MKSIMICILLLSAGKGCEQDHQLPLSGATSQAWSGGAAGSGRGINYIIYLNMKNTSDYTFDSLWVQEKRLPVAIDERRSAGDTLVLTVTDMTQNIRNIDDMNNASKEVLPVPFPVKADVAGILGYHYKGKQKYLLIGSWTKLKPLYYP